MRGPCLPHAAGAAAVVATAASAAYGCARKNIHCPICMIRQSAGESSTLQARGMRSCSYEHGVRCDQVRPACGQCVKSRRDCGGYRNEIDLMFRDQTEKTEKTVHRKQTPPTNQLAVRFREQKTPASLTMYIPETDWKTAAENYFFFNYAPISDPLDRTPGYLPCLPFLLSNSPQSPLLHCTVDAVALAVFACRRQHPALVVEASRSYAQALSQLHLALQNPATATSNSSLMAVMLLALYELVAPNSQPARDWARHIGGAMAIAKLRAKSQPMDYVSKRLCLAVLNHNSIRGFYFPTENEELTRLALNVDPQSTFSRLNRYLTRAPLLRYMVCNVVATEDLAQKQDKLTKAIAFAMLMEDEVGGIGTDVVGHEVSEPVRDFTSPKFPFSTRADALREILNLRRNMFRVGQVVVQDGLSRLISDSAEHDLQVDPDVLAYLKSQEEISSMALEIIGAASGPSEISSIVSTPMSSVDGSMSGELTPDNSWRSTRSETPDDILIPDRKTIELIFPLHALATSRMVPEAERDRAARLLKRIGTETGITLARRLYAQIDEDMDSLWD
ncbi:hypothetical protein FH972_023951 [Carpinus fangiana]|uniref:Zn(2)-C6 fungal-type domain-containing protein n=1 Tax=Carpinus fangiana TaxID=176857 RepID=A0A5N6KX50_9ROSI|nr:hypothetical protein FH972_023951 [Carpinus fangiana]